MAHAFDNRNFTPVMRNSRHSNESLSPMWPTERSQTHCPVSSSTTTMTQQQQERRMFHLTSARAQQFKSTVPYHPTDPCAPYSPLSLAANGSLSRPPASQPSTNGAVLTVRSEKEFSKWNFTMTHTHTLIPSFRSTCEFAVRETSADDTNVQSDIHNE